MKKKMTCLQKFALFGLVAVGIVYLVAIIVLLVSPRTAHAKSVPTWEGNNLVVREVPDGKIVATGKPEGLSPEDALMLVEGKKNEVVVKDTIGNANYSFSLPWIKSRTKYTDNVVTYLNSRYQPWFVHPLPIRVVLDNEQVVSFLYLWIPSLFILIMSIEKSPPAVWMKKLLVCYIAVFASMFASTFVGWVMPYDESVRTGIGLIMGVLIGMTAGAFSGSGIGTIATALVGSMSGTFAGGRQYEFILHVALFLLAVEVVCFIIAQLVRLIVNAKRRREEAILRSVGI